MRILVIWSATMCLALAWSAARANNFDGTKPLICASLDTFACEPGEDCLTASPEALNVPQFIRLDFEGKIARARRPDGTERVSNLNSVSQDAGELILQGVQNGLGWSIAITQENGRMALTAAGNHIAFVIFGACAPLLARDTSAVSYGSHQVGPALGASASC